MTEQKKNSTRKKTTRKKGPTKAEMEKLAAKKRLRDEICALLLAAFGIFLAVSLQTGAAGELGQGMKWLFLGFFGRVAYLLPYYMIIYGFLLFTKKTAHTGMRATACVCITFIMMVILNASFFLTTETMKDISFVYLKEIFELGAKGAGFFGSLLGILLIQLIGKTGLWIFSIVAILISLLLVINTPISKYLDEFKMKREAMKLQRQAEDEADSVLQQEKAAAMAEAVAAGEISVPRRKLPFQKPIFDEVKRPLTPNQVKIMDYMKDEELFDKVDNGLQTGIEESRIDEPGKGLNRVSASEVADGPIKDTKESGPVVHFSGDQPSVSIPAAESSQAAASPVAAVSTASNAAAYASGTNDAKASERITAEKGKSQDVIPDLKISGVTSVVNSAYEIPSIELLNKAPVDKNIGEKAMLQAKAQKLEETLHNFGVNAKVSQVTKGPAVTRYEIQPNVGVKVSSIVRLADDIALNLEAKSIRMEAPIPGKAAVGIEVENDRVNMVSIREIIESGEFKTAKSKISFSVGKDIAGKAIVADLKGMPHMLIAGSTGSGKSVCINSLIISILYKARPDEVKLVLIDPKVVELSNYNGIPHLLIPVVTEPSKAAAALNWAVAEMTDRYKKFAEQGVRDLESYNNAMKEKELTDQLLPQIVIVIDELADLMMAAPSQVEEAICRLAQMARAAGMHLIVATQRPSVDIITGVIKANIPSRIAFAVSSQFDSRTILDMAGAEKLVGKGDMLFSPLGMSKPTRVQGCFISDSEVHNVIEFLKKDIDTPVYASDVLHTIDKVQNNAVHEDEDELLADAIETVVRAEQASVSMLQRRFRIGYNRAARLVDMMESRGIIGPADGSRPRQVLMSLSQWMALDSGEEAEAAASPTEPDGSVAAGENSEAADEAIK